METGRRIEERGGVGEGGGRLYSSVTPPNFLEPVQTDIEKPEWKISRGVTGARERERLSE